MRPRIAVAAGGDLDRVRRIVERAHKGCYVAHVNAEIVVEPVIEHAASGPAAEAS